MLMKEKINKQNDNFKDCWELMKKSYETKKRTKNDNRIKKLR